MEHHPICLTSHELLGILTLTPEKLPDVMLDNMKLDESQILTLNQPSRLFPWRTLYSNLKLALSYSGKEVENPAEYLHDKLKDFGLLECQHQYPHQISPVMQYRASLLFILLLEPSVIHFSYTFDDMEPETQLQCIRFTREKLLETKQPAILFSRQLLPVLHFSDQLLLWEYHTTPISIERRKAKDFLPCNYNQVHRFLSVNSQ